MSNFESTVPFNGYEFLSKTPKGLALLSDMKPTGDLTNQLFGQIADSLPSSGSLAESRMHAAGTIAKYLPHIVTLGDNLASEDDSIRVVAHNHRTLREPLDMAFLTMQKFPDKDIVMPINMPWGSLIHTEHVQMLQERLGIKLSPLVTPRTVDRLTSSDELRQVKSILEASFWNDLESMRDTGGSCIVATTAGRGYQFADRMQYETGISASGQTIAPVIGSMVLNAIRHKMTDKFIVTPANLNPGPGAELGKFNAGIEYDIRIGQDITFNSLIEARKTAEVDGYDRKVAKTIADYTVRKSIADLGNAELEIAT